MRKSTHRKHYELTNPLTYVLRGMAPLRTAQAEMTLLGVKNHGALETLTKGQGTKDDALTIHCAMFTALVMARRGTGDEWAACLDSGRQAAIALILRGNMTGRYVFTGPELSAVNAALEVHEAQLDATTIAEFEADVKEAARLIRSTKLTANKKEIA